MRATVRIYGKPFFVATGATAADRTERVSAEAILRRHVRIAMTTHALGTADRKRQSVLL